MSRAPSLPCPLPGVAELKGRTVTLERLNSERHGADLWPAIGALSALWENVPPGPFADEAQFVSWLADRAQKPGQSLYALVNPGGTALGLFLLLNIEPAVGRMEFGLMLGPGIGRSTAATEAFFLMGRYIFETLGYRRMEWRCSPENTASTRAALRLGFTLEGVLRQNAWIKGRNWDTVLYSIIDGEWPRRSARLTRWLSPENFDSKGRQKTKLSEM